MGNNGNSDPLDLRENGKSEDPNKFRARYARDPLLYGTSPNEDRTRQVLIAGGSKCYQGDPWKNRLLWTDPLLGEELSLQFKICRPKKKNN